MADNMNIFVVTFKVDNDSDGYTTHLISNRFDADNIPQMFFRLDDAKAFVMDVVQNTLCDVPNSIDIADDTWSCYGDQLSTFGIGNGTGIPWLTMADCSGADVSFFIHRMIVR